jgi:DNA-binding MarR family transcriptional regulator/N-acetylglutamate synthase-like GNAT family acetyltransferase
LPKSTFLDETMEVRTAIPAQLVDAVRRYNRFYTLRLGLLNQHLVDSRWSLTEARVLYELAHRQDPAAADLSRDLSLDPGYLSRLLQRFAAAGLIERRRSDRDARRHPVQLTAAGHEQFAALDRGARRQVERLLEPLASGEREALVAAMDAIERRLDAGAQPVALRDLAPGDVGWIVERHGALYATEFGYDATFEALVARIGADFLQQRDPARERGWIAERAGVRVGSVLLVRADEQTAKLRLLLVEPAARGAGVGRALVDACTAFAREAGYRRITLWTQSHLAAARAIYEAAGYQRVAEEAHRSFGLDLVSETWMLAL